MNRPLAPSEVSHGFRFGSKDILVSEKYRQVQFGLSFPGISENNFRSAWHPREKQVIWFLKLMPFLTYFDSVCLFNKYPLGRA